MMVRGVVVVEVGVEVELMTVEHLELLGLGVELGEKVGHLLL